MKLKDEKGAIVVEATLSLTFFIFAMLMILSIANICLAQSKIGTALNSAAIEISEYSYLYGLTGLNDKHKELAHKGAEADEKIGNVASGVAELYGSISEIANVGSNIKISDFSDITNAYNSISGNVNQAQASANQIIDTVKSVADDPKAFILSLGALIGTGAWNTVNTEVSGIIGQNFMKKHLNNKKGGDYETYLKWLHVVPKGGSYLKGLNFSQSKVFANGTEDIDLVVTYKVRVIKLLGVEKDFVFTQRAHTKGWFGNKSSSEET